MSMPKPSASRARELLEYDHQTGALIWRTTRGKARQGAVAGAPTGNGRVQIMLDQHNALAHHWVWLIMTGEWPPPGLDIDHRDEDPTNNRWENLRLVSRGANMQNITQPNSHNKSGFRGVDFFRPTKKWRACIRTDGRQRVLGYFATPEEASAAYVEAKTAEHPYWQGVRT